MSKKHKTNCPNCGAPRRGMDACEYCGTVFGKKKDKNKPKKQVEKDKARVYAERYKEIGGDESILSLIQKVEHLKESVSQLPTPGIMIS